MIDHLVGHLARRGYEAHRSGALSFSSATSDPSLKAGDGQMELRMPIWAVVYLAVTTLLFVGLAAIVQYTYGYLIFTLCMIESPSTSLYAPVEKNESTGFEDSDKKAGQEVPLVEEAPITSGLFRAEKHLVARGGFMSRFRGFSMMIFQTLASNGLAQFFVHNLYGNTGSQLAAAVLSRVAVAHISLGWTHIAISEPSPKYWFQRIPSFRTWKKVALPTFIAAVTQQVAMELPVRLARSLQLSITPENMNTAYLKMALIALVGFALVFLVSIPARVILTRVQSSLLPEEQESIVPFDRSFNGKVVPEIVGGSGILSMLDAWKTFDFQSRIRLLKLYIKVSVIQHLLVVLYLVSTVGLLLITIGPKAIMESKDLLTIDAHPKLT